MTYLLLALGLVLLTAGADVLVRGASSIASRLGLSELVVGLTVVAFGTSAPELAVSVKSAHAGQGGIAMGNVIGSNIFNIAVILGLSAMVCPLAVHLKIIRRDMPLLLAVSTLFAVLLSTGGGLSRPEGGLLVAGLVGYLAWSVAAERKPGPPGAAGPADGGAPMRLPVALALVAAGLALLVFGARLLVDNATHLARGLGVGEEVIGLTIVAAGTSLPELATSLVAALRRQTDIAIGNIVGSNLFNLLGIAGIAALVRPVDAGGISGRDLGFMLAAAVALLPLMRSGFKIARWEGALLFAGFVAYLWAVWPKPGA